MSMEGYFKSIAKHLSADDGGGVVSSARRNSSDSQTGRQHISNASMSIAIGGVQPQRRTSSNLSHSQTTGQTDSTLQMKMVQQQGRDLQQLNMMQQQMFPSSLQGQNSRQASISSLQHRPGSAVGGQEKRGSTPSHQNNPYPNSQELLSMLDEDIQETSKQEKQNAQLAMIKAQQGQLQGQGGQGGAGQRQQEQMAGQQNPNKNNANQSHAQGQIAQLQNFLQMHGHQLTPQQRMSLQQQLMALQQHTQQQQVQNQTAIGQQTVMGNNMNQAALQMLQQQQQGGRGIDDSMNRQREQLRQLQSLVRQHHGKVSSQDQMDALLAQAQQRANSVAGGRQHRQSSSSAVMQQMIQRQQKQMGNGIVQPTIQSHSQPTPSQTSVPPQPQNATRCTRVVPVSICPSSDMGNVAEAALIYTKFALESIVASLNAAGPAGRREKYTIRNLSTCLGAWDLNSDNNHKRQKLDGSKENDGNADTAFSYYYERSCPILLDASVQQRVAFSVEDFGHHAGGDGSANQDLPFVAGAIVLTYGTDSKFTGGIGEEGVLTKAIIEFFYEDTVAMLSGSEGHKATKNDDLVEAEEQIFARLDGDSSSELVNAALYALAPSMKNTRHAPKMNEGGENLAGEFSSSSDDGIYTPTIWSGNTNRVYQYCLLSNFDEAGNERPSKRLCVAIQKKSQDGCGGGDKGPAKGVCRITLTLSPASVLTKKRQMIKEENEENFEARLAASPSTVHKNIRQSLRLLRPPKLQSVGGGQEILAPGNKRRQNLRRRSITQMIDPTLIAVGIRCKHELLLDADEVGKVYLNGTLTVDCAKSGKSNSPIAGGDALGAHLLFGVDFTLPSFKVASGSLPDKDTLEKEYGNLLIDSLIDASQFDLDVAGKLLNRLINGKTELEKDDDAVQSSDNLSGNKRARFHDSLPAAERDTAIKFDDTSKPCLESISLSSFAVDPVGIGAKALGTKFRLQHGKEVFPCEFGSDEKTRLKKILGSQKIAKIVPRRARDVLKRGGFLSLNTMAAFTWGDAAASWDGDHTIAMRAADALQGAMKLLKDSGCTDIKANKIKFVSRRSLEPSDNPAGDVSKLRCWYDPSTECYYVNDLILSARDEDSDDKSPSTNDISLPKDQVEEGIEAKDGVRGRKSVEDGSSSIKEEDSGDKRDEEDNEPKDNDQSSSGSKPPDADTKNSAAFQLAFYIAREHPDVCVLENFTLFHR
mmetsp:Transcript_33162/g.74499  ORF Transcript_33162/g.74499 Transcript_33162/m.74499 type:complete len:1207 (-) Transcript_33162:65-3685(-)